MTLLLLSNKRSLDNLCLFQHLQSYSIDTNQLRRNAKILKQEVCAIDEAGPGNVVEPAETPALQESDWYDDFIFKFLYMCSIIFIFDLLNFHNNSIFLRFYFSLPFIFLVKLTDLTVCNFLFYALVLKGVTECWALSIETGNTDVIDLHEIV